ncbi:MAG: potassium-transporting ATPase subunit F [Coriobacteriia bacterium]|jgi:K+-transporting ATPase KdpF subunit|nr:potassium-transporting ATPase subunit F [Coriobacteriia bacterium]
MTIEYIVTGVLGAGVLVYLTFALIYPEKF